MDAATERQFREFVEARSAALMRLAYLLAGGEQHAAEDLLQTALAKTAARWTKVDSPDLYVRRVMYHQQVNSWRLKWRRRETQVAVLPDEARPDDTSAVDLPGGRREHRRRGLLHGPHAVTRQRTEDR